MTSDRIEQLRAAYAAAIDAADAADALEALEAFRNSGEPALSLDDVLARLDIDAANAAFNATEKEVRGD